MTPDQYRREGFLTGIEAAANARGMWFGFNSSGEPTGEYCTVKAHDPGDMKLYISHDAIRAIDPTEVLAKVGTVTDAAVWPDFRAPAMYKDPCEGWEDPRLPDFRTIFAEGRKCGYSIGLHGSMRRDCDLIAAPWVSNPSTPDQLISALCAALNARQVGPVEEKPAGRVAVALQVDGYVKTIDLSIMPTVNLPAPNAVARLVEAAQALVDHEALQDREYMSAHLNKKLDAVRAALAAMETDHD